MNKYIHFKYIDTNLIFKHVIQAFETFMLIIKLYYIMNVYLINENEIQ